MVGRASNVRPRFCECVCTRPYLHIHNSSYNLMKCLATIYMIAYQSQDPQTPPCAGETAWSNMTQSLGNYCDFVTYLECNQLTLMCNQNAYILVCQPHKRP